MSSLSIYLRLTRMTISLAAALSALAGYIIAGSGFDLGMLALGSGLLLLAGGASALNQYQERDLDALMQRTRTRPIPSGLITPLHALLVAIVLIISGLALLAMASPLASVLGLAAVVIYNALYTPLKRISALSITIGALAGALPPVMGWVAGGGHLLDKGCMALGLYFWLWQMPHSMGIMQRHAEDYMRAGLPTLLGPLTWWQLVRVRAVWMLALGALSLMLPGMLLSPQPWLMLIVVGLSVWIMLAALRSLYTGKGAATFGSAATLGSAGGR